MLENCTKSLQEKEELLKQKKKEESRKRKAAETLFLEANARLKQAVINNNIEHCLDNVGGSSQIVSRGAAAREGADSNQKSIDKSKTKLIT